MNIQYEKTVITMFLAHLSNNGVVLCKKYIGESPEILDIKSIFDLRDSFHENAKVTNPGLDTGLDDSRQDIG